MARNAARLFRLHLRDTASVQIGGNAGDAAARGSSAQSGNSGVHGAGDPRFCEQARNGERRMEVLEIGLLNFVQMIAARLQHSGFPPACLTGSGCVPAAPGPTPPRVGAGGQEYTLVID